jgi:RNA polymerase sigma factor (sigma-70 family)
MIRDRHESAFEVLFDRYQARLLAFCRHMLPSEQDAEDVLQDVFVSAHKAMIADERALNVRPWLYRIARNRCLNHLRKRTADGQDSMDEHVHQNGTSTAEHVQNREELRELLREVKHLPETQRTALLLREVDALSYTEIAQSMDTTVPAVKSLLVRARVTLAEASQARLLSCGEVRLQLAEAAEGLRKLEGPARHHVRRCEECTEFRDQLQDNSKALAALFPLGPLAIFKGFILAKLGIGGGGTGSGAAAGTAAAGAAGGGGAAVAGGAAAGGGAITLGGVAGGASGIGGAVGGALGAKAAAGVASVALLTAGAVEVKNYVNNGGGAPREPLAALTRDTGATSGAQAVQASEQVRTAQIDERLAETASAPATEPKPAEATPTAEDAVATDPATPATTEPTEPTLVDDAEPTDDGSPTPVAPVDVPPKVTVEPPTTHTPPTTTTPNPGTAVVGPGEAPAPPPTATPAPEPAPPPPPDSEDDVEPGPMPPQ